FVVPAQAGTHNHRLWNMGPRVRGDDSRIRYQTFEISNMEGWNSSSAVTLRSIKPCSWAYCVNPVTSRMFSPMPEGPKPFPMIAMVSCVSGINQGSVTISALTSRRSIIANALASQNALYTLDGNHGYFATSSLRMPTRCMSGNMRVFL